MALTKAQEAIWTRARTLGGGEQGIQLDDAACAFLLARIVSDLDLGRRFPDVPGNVAALLGEEPPSSLRIPGMDARQIFERLLVAAPDADTYFACLATLQKSRLKYEAILKHQPFATVEQVGPRALLQFGQMSTDWLGGFLLWRKWFFDIDNRAGQETGYLFQPLIAHAVGGVPVPASKSPVKRHADRKKGREIDCLIARRAYEIKIRVTIAASGQGRWREELDFPIDCSKSKFTPVLVVLDPTPNPKLQELSAAFKRAKGEVYAGDAAWAHLDSLAGATMSRFLEGYVRAPLASLSAVFPPVPKEMRVSARNGELRIEIDGEVSIIQGSPGPVVEGPDPIPRDVDSELPGS